MEKSLDERKKEVRRRAKDADTDEKGDLDLHEVRQMILTGEVMSKLKGSENTKAFQEFTEGKKKRKQAKGRARCVYSSCLVRMIASNRTLYSHTHRALTHTHMTKVNSSDSDELIDDWDGERALIMPIELMGKAKNRKQTLITTFDRARALFKMWEGDASDPTSTVKIEKIVSMFEQKKKSRSTYRFFGDWGKKKDDSGRKQVYETAKKNWETK